MTNKKPPASFSGSLRIIFSLQWTGKTNLYYVRENSGSSKIATFFFLGLVKFMEFMDRKVGDNIS